MLNWKTCKYYETDELANPRPTQPKKNQVGSGIWATFSAKKKKTCVRIGVCRKQTRNLTQANCPQTQENTIDGPDEN